MWRLRFLRRVFRYPSIIDEMPKARLELARPCEHYDLNVACIPFHHFGTNITLFFTVMQLLYRPKTSFVNP